MEAQFTLKQRILLFMASLIGPLLLRLYGKTWKVRWDGQDNLQVARRIRGKVLFCFWHSRLLGLCYTHRFRGIGIMVSKSFDGEWIARIVTKLGYRVFRGSAARDGAAALVEMLKSDGGDLALTVDGPRGPAEVAKPGAITLASHSGLPVVPITCVADSAWRLKSWDAFIIPKPFSVVTVRYGEGIRIAEEMGSVDIQELAVEIGKQISRIG
jgi:hypothetical protein